LPGELASYVARLLAGTGIRGAFFRSCDAYSREALFKNRWSITNTTTFMKGASVKTTLRRENRTTDLMNEEIETENALKEKSFYDANEYPMQ
jgi:hypothetical protein